MNDPLPCPFCGNKPVLITRFVAPDSPDAYDYGCGTDGCYLEEGADWHFSKEELSAIWNRRDADPLTPPPKQ